MRNIHSFFGKSRMPLARSNWRNKLERCWSQVVSSFSSFSMKSPGLAVEILDCWANQWIVASHRPDTTALASSSMVSASSRAALTAKTRACSLALDTKDNKQV